ncbi:MAG: NUDIX domain-containing protein [Anaerolineae bacterium]|nr:NUDIX domain-containing protein [Anaerolineae bacterium]
MEFTLGFVFDSTLSHVMLIHKNRPAWQAGKVNGVGGKLEPGETPLEGIRREVREESALDIPLQDWLPVAEMQADDWRVHVFAARYGGDPARARSQTDEQVGWHPVAALPPDVISNLTWLIPLCLDRMQHGTPRLCRADY